MGLQHTFHNFHKTHGKEVCYSMLVLYRRMSYLKVMEVWREEEMKKNVAAYNEQTIFLYEEVKFDNTMVSTDIQCTEHHI